MEWLRNIWSNLKIRFKWKIAGIKTLHFKNLGEMDAWIDRHGSAMCKLGILRHDMLSPLILSCVITPDMIDDVLSNYPSYDNLRDMLTKLNEHAGEWCSTGAPGSGGILVGVEVTQEDYYWVLGDGKKRRYVSGAMTLKVREQIRDNIIRYRYI